MLDTQLSNAVAAQHFIQATMLEKKIHFGKISLRSLSGIQFVC